MNKFLRIAFWNANGLLQNEDEVTLFFKEQHIDISFTSVKLTSQLRATSKFPTSECILLLIQMDPHTEALLSS
jgi:hypothetical protein